MIYLAGPMSFRWDSDWNFPAFNAAADRLRKRGHSALNPAENFDGDTSRPRQDYMRVDLLNLLRYANAVAVLPGWEESE